MSNKPLKPIPLLDDISEAVKPHSSNTKYFSPYLVSVVAREPMNRSLSLHLGREFHAITTPLPISIRPVSQTDADSSIGMVRLSNRFMGKHKELEKYLTDRFFTITQAPTYIFDLDGTLADVEHRRHFVEGKDKHFDKFDRHHVSDLPKRDVVILLNQFVDRGIRVLVLSGRSVACFSSTIHWLRKYVRRDYPWHEHLHMRPIKHYVSDVELKRSWLNNPLIMNRNNVLGVFDDRDAVVKMWRENQLTCFQVAPGDF